MKYLELNLEQYATIPNAIFLLYYLGKCMTSGGPDDNTKCKFPFIYKNVMFTKCTLVSHNEFTYWCATQTNSTHHFQNKKWGNCSKDCPREGKLSI